MSKVDELLALADRFGRMDWEPDDLDAMEAAIREYAARLDAKVTPELVEKAWRAFDEYFGNGISAMRAALLVAVPLGEDAKDAARLKWLADRARINRFSRDHSYVVIDVWLDDERKFRVGPRDGVGMASLRTAVDAAMAAPPSDAELAREGT